MIRLARHRMGDTMIEVMLAAVILSMMLVGAYTLSARATRLNQSAYERTKASELIQEQAELLRAIRDRGDPLDADWVFISTVTPQGFYNCKNSLIPPSSLSGKFYLSVPEGSSTIVRNPNALKNTDNLYYTWVSRANSLTADYQDFNLYTCWAGIGDFGKQLAGTVVRLGAPR